MKLRISGRSVTSLCLLMLLALVGCNHEDSELDHRVNRREKIVIESSIDQVYTTRVNDDGFCDGDAIGIYITDYEGTTPTELQEKGNRATNVKFTFDESGYQWNAAEDIYWKDDKTAIDVYGYYPYGKPNAVDAYLFEVEKDQQKQAEGGNLGGYEASDFLWGKEVYCSPTEKTIRVGLKHKMAAARITLQEGEGFGEGEWLAADKQVLITNTKRKAEIDLQTGEVVAVGELPQTAIIPHESDGEFRGIVVPQVLSAGKELLKVTIDGVTYLFKKDEEFVYTAGKQHNFTIKVKKRAAGGGYEFELVSESITAWENDKASHDATAREYIIIDVDEPGHLEEAIAAADKDYTKLKNLKLTGRINAFDFIFMRDEMSSLQALNLSEVEIKGSTVASDDEIPEYAMSEKKTLMRLILPKKLTKINSRSFSYCSNLTGSLEIPEGVRYVGPGAFCECKSMTGKLLLPSTLEVIGSQAFTACGFNGALILPEGLKKIGDQAFYSCFGLVGELRLPDTLIELGESAFSDCIGFTGSLEIPSSLQAIGEEAFAFTGVDGHYKGNYNGNLILHNNLLALGKGAFRGAGFRGELVLPEELVIIPDKAFYGCDFSGELKIPESVAVIGSEAFASNWRLTGNILIPENVESIGAGAFQDCSGLQGVTISRGVETIGYNAFKMCTGLGKLVCEGTIPANVLQGAFDGVAKDNFTLEVPEQAISQYQTAVGWSEFKRISAYRNLVVRPAMATALNSSVTRRLLLNADDEWSVEEQPEWVTLNQTSGNGKTELELTFSELPQGAAAREGELVFKLNAKEYSTRCKLTQYNYAYNEDEVVTLHQATQGKGVNLVLLGDGYDAKEISQGEYMASVKEAMHHFFNIEPYKTYKDYFNVYTAIAVSPESGVGGVNTIIHNRFNSSAKGGVTVGGRYGESDYQEIFTYACKSPTVNPENISETLIIMIPNTKEYGGICYMYDNGAAIAYCPMSDYGYPYDFRGVVQHEAGGHGFGKLGDEYIYHNEFIDNCTCTCCDHVSEFEAAKQKGWYANLSLSGKMSEVPWSKFILHDKYKQFVDIFEGGYKHTRGVFRSEQNSCMNNDIPYYSTISREAIVKRIMELAGEPYSLESFVANDKVNIATEVGTRSSGVGQSQGKRAHHGPVFMGKFPQIK